ncbi:MAG: membrane protein insertase YidC, partial [Candidatus Krumholzibacteriia bacterium]
GGGAPSGTLRLAEGSGPRTITLRSAAEGGGAVLKHFTFDPERYEIRVDLELERGDGLAQIEGYRLLWTHSLESTEGNQKDDWASFQLAASAGRQVTRQGLRGGFFGGGASEDKSTSVVGELDWASMKSKYFVVAVIPESQKSGKATLIGNPKTHRMRFEIDQPFPWRGGPRETYRVYAGPIVYDRLANLGVGLEAVVELGWSWIRPFSRLVLTFMRFLHNFISNYGIIIIIVSVLSKLVFWPLSEKSFRSMREMQSVQPLMQEIRNRYKDDPQEMNRQVMALYKRRGVNPVGGCMPLVVQMPIFVALYAVLRSNIELRNAPFMLWIDNLAAPDVLFTMPFRLPGLGSDFSLLPLLMGAAMIWQSKMGSPMSMSGPGAQQQAMMKWLMPIVFIFIFYKMPSGLVLYWLVNTVLSVSQQLLINRKFAEAPAASTAALPKLQDQGRKDHGAPDRVDRPQRGRSARKGARRVGGKAR